MSKLIEKMTGYKATDKYMKCRDTQFVLGEWQECEGELVECQNGFHFCEYPSGPWAYYSDPGTRIWRVEAEMVLPKKREPGADLKRVARRIRLVEEVVIGGNHNSGYRNSGNRNSGNHNSGDLNSGDGNSGNRNSGYWNIGYGNSGYWNIGNGNSGYWNATSRSSGVFCVEPQLVKSFDVQTDLAYEEFLSKYPESYTLGRLLINPEPIPFEPYKNIPGITPEKLLALHAKHLEARK